MSDLTETVKKLKTLGEQVRKKQNRVSELRGELNCLEHEMRNQKEEIIRLARENGAIIVEITPYGVNRVHGFTVWYVGTLRREEVFKYVGERRDDGIIEEVYVSERFNLAKVVEVAKIRDKLLIYERNVYQVIWEGKEVRVEAIF